MEETAGERGRHSPRPRSRVEAIAFGLLAHRNPCVHQAGAQEPFRFGRRAPHTSRDSVRVTPEVDDSNRDRPSTRPTLRQPTNLPSARARGRRQHINKTRLLAVAAQHIPTGIVVQWPERQLQRGFRNRDEACKICARGNVRARDAHPHGSAQPKLEDPKTAIGWGHRFARTFS